MEFENIPSLNPINFFQLVLDCHKLPESKSEKSAFFKLNDKNFNTYRLASTEGLTGEFSYAEIALGWNNEGIEAYVKVNQRFIRSSYPQVNAGDSVELFFDTRDIKTSGYNTRFCHHFFFFPEPLEDRQAGELTRFRSEDAHELCNPNDLKIKAHVKTNNYTLQIFIPASCLHGYDPEQYQRLGFTYRINHGGSSQHFSVLSSEYQLEQQPSLWSSLKLTA